MSKTSASLKEKNFVAKACEITITATTALVFLLVPLFFTGLVSQGIIFEKMVLFYLLLLLGLVAWVAKGVTLGELKIKRTPLDLPLLILAIILLVSTLFSVDKGASLVGAFGSTTKSFVAFIAYVAFYYLIVNNINTRRLFIYIWSLLLGSIAIISFSTLQLFGIFILPLAATKAVSFNPIGTSSSLGIYIASLLPLLAVMLPVLKGEKSQPNKNKVSFLIMRIVVSILILTGLFILFLLGNFIFWPAVIIGIVILLMFTLAKVVSFEQSDTIMPIIIFLALIVLLVGGNFSSSLITLPTEVSLSRNLSWDIAKSSLGENLLLGTGPATFDYAFAKYRGTDFNASDLWSVRFDTASGNFFEMLTTIGILGSFSILLIALIIISIVFINLTKEGEKRIKFFILGLLASIIILVINASMSAVSGTIILLIVTLSSLMMALVMFDYSEKVKEIVFSFRASPKYALALAAIFLFVSAGVVILLTFGFKMYLADYYANQVNIRETPAEALTDLNKAIASFDQNDQYYIKRANIFRLLFDQELQAGNNAGAQEYIAMAIADAKKAVELAPNSVVNNETIALVYEQAAVYGIGGSLEWAEKYYLEVTKLEPDSPSAYIRLALIKMAQANLESTDEEKEYFYDESIKFYEQAISKKPNLATAYYGVAIVHERKGDSDKAIEYLGKAVGLASNNIDYRFELGRLYFNRGVSSQSLQQQQTKEITTADDEDENAVDEEDLSVSKESSGSGQITGNEDIEVAKAIFETILQAIPGHANSVYSLAMILETMGDRSGARERYRQLLDIVTDQATKDVILQKLSNL